MKKNWLAIGLIIVLGIIVYANSFHNPFIWDDENLIVTNPYIKDARLIKNLFTKDLGYGTQFSNFYRPLQALSYELDYYLWALNPFGFHLSNLFWHTACALAVYCLVVLIFPGAKLAPLITALLFLVHPIQTESITYISGRADPQAGLFMLLSILFYVKHMRKAWPRSVFFLCGAIAFFAFALLTKETALILPLLILLYDVSFTQDRSKFRDKLILRYSPFLWYRKVFSRYHCENRTCARKGIKLSPKAIFLLVALIYLLLRMTILNFLNRPLFLSETSLYLRMLTSAKIFTLYLSLLILPFHLHMERSLPMVSSILDKDVLFSLILLVLLGILIVKSYKYSRVLFFAGMWFFLNLIPVSNIVPLNANMAEHWLYLPSIGFFLLIALGLDKLIKKTTLTKVLSITLLIILVCFYSFLTIKRNREWKDAQRFFQSILVYNPQSVEARNCLGGIYQNQGKVDLAIDEFKQAIKIDAQNYKSYGNLGGALRRKGEYDLAASAYKRALEIRPDIPGLYNNLGNIYADKGQHQQAIETFQQALRLYPEFALCRVNLGRVYYQLGDMDSATEECKKAIALEPNLVVAHYNLALIYHRREEYDLAIDEYKTTTNLAPGNISAYLNLGTAYNVKGHLNEAIKQYEKVLELNPSFYHGYHNLGVVYFKKNDYDLAKKFFLQTLKLNPDYEPSKEFLRTLEKLEQQK